MQLTATLVLRRAADAAGLFRELVIEVGGASVAWLRPRQTARVEVGAGDVAIVGRMDWAASAPLHLSLREGEEVTVVAHLPFWRMFWPILREGRDADLSTLIQLTTRAR